MLPATKTAPAPDCLDAYAARLSGLHDLRGRYFAGLLAHRSKSVVGRLINGGRLYEYRLICVIRQLTYQIHHLTLGSL